MKALLFALALAGIGYFFVKPEKTMRYLAPFSAATSSGYDNVYWCSRGFQVEALSREARQNVSLAMEQTNVFLARPGLMHESPTGTCYLRGGVNLPGAILAWTDDNGNISIDAPKVIEFCKREFPVRYDLCWQSIISHEIGHTIGLEHIEGKEMAIMNHVPSTLRFTEADSKACARSSVCSLIRHVAP